MAKAKGKKDSNVLAKDIVDEATDESSEELLEEADADKDPKSVKAGRLGGLKGGKARAKKLTAEQRRKIAELAAQARWRKKSSC